jgi:hypothetical protein
VLVAGWRAGLPYLPVRGLTADADAWRALLRTLRRSPDWSPVSGR